jgi:hypothetical protein
MVEVLSSVLEERVASIFTFTLKMEAVVFSETLLNTSNITGCMKSKGQYVNLTALIT